MDAFLPGGRGGHRKQAKCPLCGAMERHRFLALLLDGLAPLVTRTGRVLDVAPSRYVTERIEAIRPASYVRIDLEPAADARDVDIQASLTELPFPDDAFDLIICFHVLEHIPDDHRAMQEIARVLKPGGVAVVQVPFYKGAATDEDPSASPEERTRRFGQVDHVRRYGDDFEQRLSAAGLSGTRLEARDVLSEGANQAFGIQPGVVMWFLHPATSTPVTGVSVVRASRLATLVDLQQLLTEQAEETARLEAQLETAVGEAERHRRNYERLRYHPAVRLAVDLTRPLRRLYRQTLQR